MQEEKKELKSEFLLRESKIDIQTDKRLLIYEILSSKAHVISLEKINAITKEEAKLLIKTLNKLYNDYNAGKLVFDGNFEDIHFLVEDYLIKEIGIEVGGKLHIGRSRNELIINDVRMYLRDWINNFSLKFLEKLKELLNLADLEYKNYSYLILIYNKLN
jgi:Argininosuccinate lyase